MVHKEGADMNPKSFVNQPGAYAQQQGRSGTFKELEATELYCPRCRRAVSVRKRLLLVIPEGDKYEYLCAFCSESVGTKIDRQQRPMSIIP